MWRRIAGQGGTTVQRHPRHSGPRKYNNTAGQQPRVTTRRRIMPSLEECTSTTVPIAESRSQRVKRSKCLYVDDLMNKNKTEKVTDSVLFTFQCCLLPWLLTLFLITKIVNTVDKWTQAANDYISIEFPCGGCMLLERTLFHFNVIAKSSNMWIRLVFYVICYEHPACP